MRSKVNDGSNFENRTLDRIYAIKAKVDSNPNVTYKEFGNNCSATNKCFYTLRKIDVILRSGSRKKPEYHWNNKFNVNTRLANKVASLIREDERKKYPASKASKTVVSDIENVCGDIAVAGKLFLFTDQQLWDELKNRGYSVQDNQITKQTCLK